MVASHQTSKRKIIGVVYGAMLLYFNISGGPWGMEEAISAGGPFFGLLGILAFALMWAMPMIVMTCELGTMFPCNGGYSVWVNDAMGPFWGFQESWWSWASGIVDNAIYPLLFYEAIRRNASLCALIPGLGELGGIGAYLVKLAISLAFAAPNFLTLNIVGTWLVVLSVVVLLPFVVLTIVGLPHADFSHLFDVRTPSDSLPPDGVMLHSDSGTVGADLTSVRWGTLLGVLFWNFSGFDSISTISGEVAQPEKTLWRSSLLCLAMIVLSNIVPLGVAAAADEPAWQTWTDGSFTDIAQALGGSWLANWLAIAAVIGYAGLYSAEFVEDSYQLQGMAETGLGPRVLGYTHPRFGTPWVAMALSFVLISGMLAFDFNAILALDNFFSIISCWLEIWALFVLRVREPQRERRFRCRICCACCRARLGIAERQAPSGRRNTGVRGIVSGSGGGSENENENGRGGDGDGESCLEGGRGSASNREEDDACTMVGLSAMDEVPLYGSLSRRKGEGESTAALDDDDDTAVAGQQQPITRALHHHLGRSSDASCCQLCRALSFVEVCDLVGLALLFIPPVALSAFVIIFGFMEDDTWRGTGIPISLAVDIPFLIAGVALWAVMLKLPWERWSTMQVHSSCCARCFLGCSPNPNGAARIRARSWSG